MSHKNWQHVETLTGQKEKVSSCQFGCYKYQLDWGKFGHQLHVYLWARLTLHSGFDDDCKGLWKFRQCYLTISLYTCKWFLLSIYISPFSLSISLFLFHTIIQKSKPFDSFLVWGYLPGREVNHWFVLIFATCPTFLVNNQFKFIFHHLIWIGPLPSWEKRMTN